jgi:UDPglucose 6-dehydrogenase
MLSSRSNNDDLAFMKLSVVGTGYVGLVAGACFAEYGNTVYCVDIDEKKIENLKKGILPIYEPGLEEIVLRNFERGRLLFTTSLEEAVKNSHIIFIAVGTPDGGDGRPDLTGVLKVAEDIGRLAPAYRIIVNKSTVPVGSARRVHAVASSQTQHPIDVVSNPEFLREGRAIEDFMKPERVIIGSDSERAASLMRELYMPFVQDSADIIQTTIESAELTKYACNAFLAMKISFVNEIANLCDRVGANYLDVKKGMGTDSRIGKKFLNAGIGYGGSCFPKDVRALGMIARDAGIVLPLVEQIERTNDHQKTVLVQKVKDYFKAAGKSLKGAKLAVWGLAFKAGTDDMREAPSITIIHELLKEGAKIHASDPVASETSRLIFGDTIAYEDMYQVLEGADALLVLTEWPVYSEPDFDRMKSLLKEPVIFDGRNLYRETQMKASGFKHFGIGVHHN